MCVCVPPLEHLELLFGSPGSGSWVFYVAAQSSWRRGWLEDAQRQLDTYYLFDLAHPCVPLRLSPAMLATFFSASYTSLPFLPCLPIFLIGTKMLNPEPLSARDNSLPGRLTKLAVFGATWCSCALTLGCTLTLPLHLALQTPLVSSYHSLFIYTPFLIIGLRKDHNATYGPFTRLLFHPTFDAPLLLAGFILRETPLNLRLFGPFATILDANIVQGSLPYPSDAKILAAEPYNVVAVVNMCLEYPGPVESYAAAGEFVLASSCWRVRARRSCPALVHAPSSIAPPSNSRPLGQASRSSACRMSTRARPASATCDSARRLSRRCSPRIRGSGCSYTARAGLGGRAR